MLKDIATDVDSNFYDTTLSETSVNAVQNQVITKALNKKADKTELSKKQDVISDLSEIRNKAKSALQSVPSEYITEDELDSKGYLTEHQDISGKQDKIADLEQIRANAQKGATALQTVPAKYATKTDVLEEVAKIVNSAPEAFNTLKEIADWIEEDAEPAIVLANKVEQKVDKVEGLGLSEENYTADDKAKLAGLENYDDSDIKEELSKKIESEVVVDTESTEDFEFGYDDTEIRQELTNLSERVNENEVLIEDLQNTKIDKEADDYYPQLSVGLADNLAGVDVVDSEISFRRSGGGAISDGTARIEAIKGNSVVWNQGIYNSNFAEGLLKWEASNTSLTINADGSIRATNKTGDSQGIFQYVTMPCAANHKVLVIVDFQRSDLLQTNVIVYLRKQHGGYDIGTAQISSANRERVGLVIQTTDIILGVRIYPFSYGPVGSYCDIYGCYMYDLTKMFGAGKEPTIEEFNARKPLGIDENAYNEGEVIHMNAQSLESVGVNQWDEEWELGSFNLGDGINAQASWAIRNKNYVKVLPKQGYYFNMPTNYRFAFYDVEKNFISGDSKSTNQTIIIPDNCHYLKFSTGLNTNPITTYNHDICINLSDASVNGKYFPYIKRVEDLAVIRKYFPDGMKSTDTDSDAIRYNKVINSLEKCVAIKSIKLKDLSWTYFSEAGYFYSNNIDARRGNSAGTNISCICGQYQPMNWIDFVLNYMGAKQKSVALYTYPNGEVRANICDTEFTDVASFLASLTDDDVLYYSAKDPIVTELDDNFNLDYEVWNGGTEKIVSDVPTTPLKADIAYGFNAYGKIQENSEKIEELEKNKIVVDSIIDVNSDNPISNQLFTNSFNYLGSFIKDVKDDVTALETEVSNKEDKPIEIVMIGEPADIGGTDTGVTYYLNKTNIGLSEDDSYAEYYQKVLARNVLLATGSDYQSPVNKYVHEDYVQFNIAPQFTEIGIANGSITIHSSPQTSPNGAEYYVEVRIWLTANSGGESSVFEAVYGVTTYEEIVAAVKAHKHVICFENDRVYNLNNFGEGRDLNFSCAGEVLHLIKCTTQNKWSSKSLYLEQSTYKVTSLSSASTDTQYPSAKAVYDFVQNSITNVLNEEV